MLNDGRIHPAVPNMRPIWWAPFRSDSRKQTAGQSSFAAYSTPSTTLASIAGVIGREHAGGQHTKRRLDLGRRFDPFQIIDREPNQFRVAGGKIIAKEISRRLNNVGADSFAAQLTETITNGFSIAIAQEAEKVTGVFGDHPIAPMPGKSLRELDQFRHNQSSGTRDTQRNRSVVGWIEGCDLHWGSIE
ncbi:hypothetical protein [Rathayibacter soli]|uniref:hypothetical protein n=1 Tax=Rathayibacter soli TaxID=3144168 RepID=UPI0027E45B35|nr:hypothetical protein [Glaciibacter superstes]